MPGARPMQEDLFKKTKAAPELQPGLRAKLAPLLQALLMEAAGAQPSGLKVGLGIGESGDDEDHR
jgi:hypothetical protein